MFLYLHVRQAAGKFDFVSFRGALRAEESAFPCVLLESRSLASLGMTAKLPFSAATSACLVLIYNALKFKPTG
jgi:hypothetical protein